MSDFKNQSPWGSSPGGGNGGFRRGPTPPDIDELVKKFKIQLTNLLAAEKVERNQFYLV
jgi:membrane protease subunit HflK